MATRTGGVSRIFFDGVYDNFASLADFNSLLTDIWFGTNQSTPAGWYLDGLLDEVNIWNRAVSYGGVAKGETAGGEVAELWNGGAGLELGATTAGFPFFFGVDA